MSRSVLKAKTAYGRFLGKCRSKLKTASEKAVARAERALGTRFPDGYREFVCALGEGVYCTLVRVQMPDGIVKDLKEFRDRITKYYFWDKGATVLPRQRVLESIRIADTMNGDELIFHPDDPKRLYVLPRSSEQVFAVGSTLDEAVHWMCRSGKLTAPIVFRNFDSGIDRAQLKLACIQKRPPFAKFKKALLDLKIHDHAEDASKGRQCELTLYVQALGGYVSCDGPKIAYSVCVWHDQHCQGEPLIRLLARLEDLGFVPPRTQGRLHPAIARLMPKYFPLRRVVPFPVPPEDRTPEQVVFGYLKAMCMWETGMAHWHEDGLPGEEVTVSDDVIREFCTPGRHAFKMEYQTIVGETIRPDPAHNPKKESIITIEEVAPDEIRITTESKVSFVTKHVFLLKRVKGAWRLHRVWAHGHFGVDRML